MKIFFLADTSSVHTKKWVNHFVQKGAEVTCFSFSSEALEGCRHIVIDEQLRDTVSSTTALWKKARYLRNMRNIRRIVNSEKPDILHAHFASSYGLIGNLCRYHPFVISAWGSDVFDFPRRSLVSKLVLRSNLSRADAVCSTSHAMARHLKHFTTSKITITPFGVDTDLFRPIRRKSKGTVVGTVKTLDTVYGIDVLIKAFSLICQKHQDVRLLIVGDGPKKQEYMQLTRRLGLTARVDFRGPAPNGEIPSFLNMMTVFVALSHRESFGVSLVEALSCGVPAVVSGIEGLAEIVDGQEVGFCVDPGNHNQAAQKIDQLLSDQKLRQRMSVKARNLVLKKYDWMKTARIMESLYIDLTKKRPTPG